MSELQKVVPCPTFGNDIYRPTVLEGHSQTLGEMQLPPQQEFGDYIQGEAGYLHKHDNPRFRYELLWVDWVTAEMSRVAESRTPTGPTTEQRIGSLRRRVRCQMSGALGSSLRWRSNWKSMLWMWRCCAGCACAIVLQRKGMQVEEMRKTQYSESFWHDRF